jgi:hypothetical protein
MRSKSNKSALDSNETAQRPIFDEQVMVIDALYEYPLAKRRLLAVRLTDPSSFITPSSSPPFHVLNTSAASKIKEFLMPHLRLIG